MPVYTELRFHCDCEGCSHWDTYDVADYGYDSIGESDLVYRMQDDVESHAMQDGWYPDDGGVWYCPECAKRMGLIRDPFEREAD